MTVVVLCGAARGANPYIDLFCSGLSTAGLDVALFDQAGDGTLPPAARAASVIHLHWLELWGKPPYRSLQRLNRAALPGRGLRRLLEPALNAPWLTQQRRRRFLRHFWAELDAWRAGGGKLVYTLHNLAQHEGEGGAQEQQALQALLRRADGIHLHAAYLADTVRATADAAGVTCPPLAIIPHGHYVDAYPNTVAQADARNALSVPAASAPVFLFLGMIRPYKGLEELLPAFAALENPAAVLLVAGRPRPADFAAHLAATAPRDPRVRWYPHFVADADVQLWMNAADAVVLPYRHITTSGAALLAWSFGKPVIAPALPAFSEPMQHTPFLGLTYDPTDPHSLLMALRQAAATDWHSSRAQIMAWVQQFAWPDIGRQMAAFYRQIS
ncbi:MAG: glycosyltransferase [Caldilineales bacterium]